MAVTPVARTCLIRIISVHMLDAWSGCCSSIVRAHQQPAALRAPRGCPDPAANQQRVLCAQAEMRVL
jgi:hypothetical protein